MRILPILYEINFEEVNKYSPALADKFAIKFEGDYDVIISKISELVKPRFEISNEEAENLINYYNNSNQYEQKVIIHSFSAE